jgi:hypothetical protein
MVKKLERAEKGVTSGFRSPALRCRFHKSLPDRIQPHRRLDSTTKEENSRKCSGPWWPTLPEELIKNCRVEEESFGLGEANNVA